MPMINCDKKTPFSLVPLEVLYKILSYSDISDVISFAAATNRPEILDVLKIPHLWTRCVIGSLYLYRSLDYLGDHIVHLSVVGSVKFDRNFKPRKERFFKSRELLPKLVINRIVLKCPIIKTLELDKCVIGPHFNTSFFPKSLETLILRSTIFVKKSSFFTNVWTNLSNLKELRMENIQNFNKDDCYAVISSRNIDFDIKFGVNQHSPTFIFYRL